MPRVPPESFGDRELLHVFTACTLAEAQQAETALSERGVNYVVEVEELGRTLFGSPRSVVAFYVEVEKAEYCAAELTTIGLGIGVMIDPEG
jgi:hypothetical protein